MIQTGPKENYCFTEVSRDIIGGERFLGKLYGIAAGVLGMKAVAALTELELIEDEMTAEWELSEVVRPVTAIEGAEIPPPNELRLPLLHRGFKVDDERASRYPDTAYLKNRLKKRGLKDTFATIAEKHGEELEGGSVWFDEARYLRSPGDSAILGLSLQAGHVTTQVLVEQADAAEQELKSISQPMYKLKQPWNLAMAVGRFDIPGGEDSAARRLLLERVQLRLPIRLRLGQIRFSSDDLA